MLSRAVCYVNNIWFPATCPAFSLSLRSNMDSARKSFLSICPPLAHRTLFGYTLSYNKVSSSKHFPHHTILSVTSRLISVVPTARAPRGHRSHLCFTQYSTIFGSLFSTNNCRTNTVKNKVIDLYLFSPVVQIGALILPSMHWMPAMC